MALTWSSAYSTGHTALDEDHKVLFSIVNQFTAGRDLPAARLALTQLVQYSAAHFAREEAVVAALGLDLLTHKKMHDVLLKNLRGLMLPTGSATPGANEAQVVAQTAALLEMWVYNHVAREDVKLLPQIKKLQQQRQRAKG
jgi:hemerythrin-like metal-binding protein